MAANRTRFPGVISKFDGRPSPLDGSCYHVSADNYRLIVWHRHWQKPVDGSRNRLASVELDRDRSVGAGQRSHAVIRGRTESR